MKKDRYMFTGICVNSGEGGTWAAIYYAFEVNSSETPMICAHPSTIPMVLCGEIMAEWFVIFLRIILYKNLSKTVWLFAIWITPPLSFMLRKFSSPAAPEVVKITTSGAVSDEKYQKWRNFHFLLLQSQSSVE